MDHFKLFEKLISAGNTVLDVGGHKGNYARRFSGIVEGKGRMYSFEPHPDLYPQLENVAIHCSSSNTFPFSYAVNDAIGQDILFSGSNELHDQASTICIELANSDRLGTMIRKFNVRTISLDYLFVKSLKSRQTLSR
ncbi:FkbM family methyltransferase [Nitrospira sp. M1]